MRRGKVSPSHQGEIEPQPLASSGKLPGQGSTCHALSPGEAELVVGQPLSDSQTKRWMHWAMAIFYLLAGVMHLRAPEAFLPTMPSWAPAPREVILFTGACEIAGTIALVTRPLRWWAGVMLALYAACVFPANIKHAVYNVQLPQLPTSWWYHAPRLALQPVIIWWALYCAQVVSWPFRGRLDRSRASGDDSG
jgi:uncharacterized membrane protein